MKIKNLVEGLTAQQRSVPQLPAQARARHISVLGAKTDPEHPFAGYMVGADESADPGKKSIGPDKNDPYEKGWRAGFRQNEFNPYPAGSKEAGQWDDGYAEARAQPDHYNEAVEEATSDPKFDKMLKGITGKKAVAKQQKTDTKQQTRDAFGSMFGGTSADLLKNLKIREQGVAEEQLDEKCWDTHRQVGMKKKGNRSVPNCVKKEGAERNELDTPAVQAALAKMAERHKGEKWSKEQLAALGKRIAARGQNKKDVEETNFAQAGEVLGGVVGGIGGMALTKGKKSGYVAGTAAGSAAGNAAGRWIDKKLEPKIGKDEVGPTKTVSRYQKSAVSEDDVEDFLARGGKITQVKPNRGPRNPGLSLGSRHIGGGGDGARASRTGRGSKPQGKPVVAVESVTKEDIITKLKARLGDYLSDIGKEIKKDPDLVDKLAAKAPSDQMGPPVKTITTDDGHQIQIHGNEDDGFRISIKNKAATTKFNNLDEAVMACEMYCAQRRKQAESADYIDEAGKDACYHKVKSRYKIWPSAYASGALVRCRKVGADNWGDKSKK